MKTNNSQNPAGRKATGLTGSTATNKVAGNVKTGSGLRGRGRKKKYTEDDEFADLNMGWEADEQNDISSSWTGSASRRKSYNDDEDSDSYEGTGYARGRMNYDSDDELSNDPYETFRRG